MPFVWHVEGAVTKLQEIKIFCKQHGLQLSKRCARTGTVSISYGVRWQEGKGWIGWADCFDGYQELYDYLLSCKDSNTRPWSA